MRASGAHLADGGVSEERESVEDDLQLHIIMPVVLGILLVVLLIGGFAVCVRRKGKNLHPKMKLYQFHIKNV